MSLGVLIRLKYDIKELSDAVAGGQTFYCKYILKQSIFVATVLRQKPGYITVRRRRHLSTAYIDNCCVHKMTWNFRCLYPSINMKEISSRPMDKV